MLNKSFLLLSLLVSAFMNPVLAATEQVPASWPSEHGQFSVAYESQLDPIVINQIHSWTLHVTDADGNPVNGAEVTVKGGMPAHNHGLATSPTVEPLGGGDYLLQGLRFHMMGHWVMTLSIRYMGVSDNVVIPLDL